MLAGRQLVQNLDIGGRRIGAGEPCFVAVEIGLNHNGELDLAHRLIDAAADGGADGVKFQTYRTEDFVTDRDVTYEYVSAGENVVETQYDMFKRYELPEDAWPQLRDHCASRGVVFFSTPTGSDTLAQLVRLGVPLLKNGSDYLVHLPLIREMARSGIPTVLSAGMSTLDEIRAAVDAFRGAGGSKLILLHCTSSYPAPAEDVHLRKIPVLQEMFDCPVGFSDHTDGVVAALGAVALGGCFLEKHFTLDKNLPGPDHRFSADPDELHGLVAAVRTLEQSLGDSRIGPAPSERVGRRDYRLSCVAAHDLGAGNVLTEEDVAYRRPGNGVSPAAVGALLGRRLRVDVPAGRPLALEDVEQP
jgi:N,N'-diacetyllegionaminate synthase